MCGSVSTVLARQYIIKLGMLQDCYRDALVQLVKLTFAGYQFLLVINTCMTFLQAHDITAACPLLGLFQIKDNHDASWKTCSYMCTKGQILCRYSI